MQIIINQADIEKAITNFILNRMTLNDNVNIEIDLKATRGAEGFQAIIDIQDKADGEQTLDISRRVSTARASQSSGSSEASKDDSRGSVADEDSVEESDDQPATTTGASLFGSKPKND